MGRFYYGMREYNLITFGDYTTTGGDTWGSVAVQGNYTDNQSTQISQYWIARNTNRSSVTDPLLLVGGTVKLGANVAQSNIRSGGVTAINRATNPGAALADNKTDLTIPTGGKLHEDGGFSGGISGVSSSPFDNYDKYASVVQFEKLKTNLLTAQQTLAKNGNSPTLSVTTPPNSSNQWTVTTSGTGVNYWNISLETLKTASEITINAAPGTALVINLKLAAGVNNQLPHINFTVKHGDIVNGSSQQLTQVFDANRVLWNAYYDNSTLSGTLTTSDADLYGSLLSPNSDIVAKTRIWGQIAAKSFTQNSGVEIHQALFTVDSTMIPEPSTVALGSGALALGFVLWRRRRQRNAQ